ncbi:hypothetical protein ACWD0J_20995 [Streptomyces sp. NPDC003011]
MQKLVIDQSEVRLSERLAARGAPGFPRPLSWWQRYAPSWLDVTEDDHGRLVLEPNGHRADGIVLEVTTALRRRHLRYALNWIGDQIHLDFSSAVFLVPVPDRHTRGPA